MCGSSTKQRIGTALRQLMNERPFDKITVQNLMDATNMKRQSFYYHFRDTRDVLLWICRQELVEPLLRSELDFLDWSLLAMELTERDRNFYRKLLSAVHPDFIRQIGNQVLWQRTVQLLYPGTPETDLNAGERYVVEFFVQAMLEQFLRFAAGRAPLDRSLARERIGALHAAIRGSCG